MLSQLRDFLGARADDPEVTQLLQAQHLPYRVAPVAERGTIAFVPADGEAYTVEEAVVRSTLSTFLTVANSYNPADGCRLAPMRK